jgi:hypothetical protein
LCAFEAKCAVEQFSKGELCEWSAVAVPFHLDSDVDMEFDVENPSCTDLKLESLTGADLKAFMVTWTGSIFCEPFLHRLVDATSDEMVAPLKAAIVEMLTRIPSPQSRDRSVKFGSHTAFEEVLKTLRGILGLIDPAPFSHGQGLSDVEFVYSKGSAPGDSLCTSEWIAVGKQMQRVLTKPDANGRVDWQNRYPRSRNLSLII